MILEPDQWQEMGEHLDFHRSLKFSQQMVSCKIYFQRNSAQNSAGTIYL